MGEQTNGWPFDPSSANGRSIKSEPHSTWTIAGVAERLGVSVPTLRSWDRRYGLGPSHRTVGGHRRYSVGDLAKLQRVVQLIDSGIPAGSAAKIVEQRVPEAASEPPVGDAVTGFHEAIEALDQSEIIRHARVLLDDLGIEKAWTLIFVPALQQAGTRWLTEDTGIACEHLLSSAVLRALNDHSASFPRVATRTPDVFLTPTEGELHSLALHAAACGLAALGLSGFVADSMPSDALVSAIGRIRPRSILLWSQSEATASSRTIVNLLPLVPVVYIGGPGWPDGLGPGVTVLRDLPMAMTLFAAHLGGAQMRSG